MNQMARRIAYIQYANPAAYPPLEHSSRILAERGWDVQFLGGGASGASDIFTFPPHVRIRVKRWRYTTPGWKQKAHYMAFSFWCVWQIWRTSSEWIYASDPLSCPAAWLASFLPRRKVIYHEHDSPCTTDTTAFMRGVLRTRQLLSRRAAAVLLPNAERARVYAEAVGPCGPILTVWNCPRRGEVTSGVLVMSVRAIVFYHGSLNALRLPTTVLKALDLVKQECVLQFAGYTTEGHHDFVRMFLNEAARLRLGARVQYMGSLARAELLKVCAKADLGLAFVPSESRDLNMRAMAGASNKPFDYLACGLGLLVTDLPDWQAMFVDTGAARACTPESPESIAHAIDWWMENGPRTEAARERGRQRIRTEWNYETQFEPVLKILEPESNYVTHRSTF